MTLAVVSKRLATLEGRVGVRLIQRTTRSLSATEEGARLLIDVDRALEAIEEGEQRLVGGRDEPAGALRMAPELSRRVSITPSVGCARSPVSVPTWQGACSGYGVTS